LVFGQRAGEHAAKFAKDHTLGQIDAGQVADVGRAALRPFEHAGSGANGEGPYQVQQDLQVMMQDLVGIVRTESELTRALEELDRLRERSQRVQVHGNREYNPAWHTALDLHNLLTVSEAIIHAAIERRESRGAHFRDDRLGKDEALGKVNLIVRKSRDGAMQVSREPIAEVRPNLRQIIEDMR
jgi:succinate dehydrogenase / fumarate reductase flavoprotein subunit